MSLEAIYLATLVMMSQNRQSEKDRLRDNLEATEVDTMSKEQTEIKEINVKQLGILLKQEEMEHQLNQVTSYLERLEQKTDTLLAMYNRRRNGNDRRGPTTNPDSGDGQSLQGTSEYDPADGGFTSNTTDDGGTRTDPEATGNASTPTTVTDTDNNDTIYGRPTSTYAILR